MQGDEIRAIVRIGAALRDSKARDSRLRRRAVAVAALAGLLTLTAVFPVRTLLVWNASPSAPVGLYGITAPDDLRRGDMVIARLSPPWRALADARRYVPAGVPVVKRVAAVPGDTVCARGPDLFVDGRWRAARRVFDGHGLRMPWWRGCWTLRDGAVLLLNAPPASFDGRYFGPTVRGDIIGKAHALWLR
jgi:conjugative transfer signal peptidase TraF